LEKQLELLQSDPELMMCGTSFIAMGKRRLCFLKFPSPTNHHEIYDQMPTRSQFLGLNTMMKSYVISQFTDFYQVYFGDALADADLASRIVDQFKTMKVRSPFYYYRIVEGSISRKNSSVRSLNQYKEIAFLSQ